MGGQLTIYLFLDSHPGTNPKQRLAIRIGMISRKEKHLPTFALSWPDSLGVSAMLVGQKGRKLQNSSSSASTTIGGERLFAEGT